MKSTLLKSIVTTVAIGITMALTSVVAMAAGTAPSKDSNGVWTYTINGVETQEDLSTAGFELAGGHNFEVKTETAGTALKLSKTSTKTKGIKFTVPNDEDEYYIDVYVSVNTNGDKPKLTVSNGTTNYLSETLTSRSMISYRLNTAIAKDTEVYMSTDTKSTLVYKVIILPKNSANSAVSMTSANAPSGDKYAVDSTYSYIIHTVTAAEMGYNELALANSSDEVVKSTDTVYSTITFPDGSSITAPEDTYLYAVKVNKTTAPTAVNYKWINNNQ